MATRAGARRKGLVAMKDVPKELADKWETVVRVSSEKLFESRKKMKEAIGQRPYRGLPVKQDELRGRWAQIHNDKDALADLLQTNARFKRDGAVLVPKALMRTIRELNEERVKGGFE